MDALKSLAAALLLVGFWLAFPGILVAQYIPNGGMEKWDTAYFSSQAPYPTGWLHNIGCWAYNTWCPSPPLTTEKSTDANSGLFAAKLETKPWYCSGLNGILVLGDCIAYPSFVGMPFAQRPDALNFYYKFQAVGPDTAQALIRLYTLSPCGTIDQKVGEGVADIFTSNTTYVFMSVPILYFLPDQPDIAQVFFTTRKSPPFLLTGAGAIGTTLWIDDVDVSGGTIGVPDPTGKSGWSVSSDPEAGTLKIQWKYPGKAGRFQLFDDAGRGVINAPILRSGSTTLNVGHLPDGIYYYTLSDADGLAARGKTIFIRR